MTTLEGNKLIAEFDGWVECDNELFKKDGMTIDINQLKYNESWDMLKPIIDSIYTYIVAVPDRVKPVSNLSIVVAIYPAWQATIQFIQWYNSQPKTDNNDK